MTTDEEVLVDRFVDKVSIRFLFNSVQMFNNFMPGPD